MTEISSIPDTVNLEIPVDAWTEPFWKGTAEHRLTMPRCGDCGRFRWPPGPFCPACQSQAVEWVDPGAPSLYSYTIVSETRDMGGGPARFTVPALVEFAGADGVRLLAAIVGAPRDALRIGMALRANWTAAADATIPIFCIE